MINRRSLITGLISLVAAPAIVRAGSLMPVNSLLIPDTIVGHNYHIGKGLLSFKMSNGDWIDIGNVSNFTFVPSSEASWAK